MTVSNDMTAPQEPLVVERRMSVGALPSARVMPGTPSSVRQSNLSLITGLILSAPEGMSRAQVSASTGLTGATASRLIRELITLGIVSEEAAESKGGMGRPSTPVRAASRTIIGIGLEINVDYVAGCAVDLTGAIVAEFVTDISALDATTPDTVLPLLLAASADMVAKLRREGVQEICGVCLAIPGVVDRNEGRIEYASNLGWSKVVPGELLGGLLGDPALFSVENDANLQMIAATASLSLRTDEAPSFLYVFSEIGIGGAILRDGVLERGASGWAGEIGHTTVDPHGLPCHCGSAGCLETFIGRRFLLAAAALPPTATTGDIVAALESHSPAVIAAVNRAGTALGIALANALNLLDIRNVIIGTGLSPLMPWLSPLIEPELDKRLLGRTSKDVELLRMPVAHLPSSIGGAITCIQNRLSPENIAG